MNSDEKYMLRCLELSTLGAGYTAPNPMVGAVLVYNDSIIGEGFHHAPGKAHAEVIAIQSCGDAGKLSRSTLYVNLEPCSHHGRTPPCCMLIADRKIPGVVIGTPDTNPLVNGDGIQYLRERGCKVTVGILEDECRKLNRRFFTWHEKKRPYVILKWAQSEDGFIDLIRKRGENAPWITGDFERRLVHKWRAEEQAIMVGTNTALKDDPRLNVREWTGRNPLRIVIDRNLRLSTDLHLFDHSIPTLVYTEQTRAKERHLEYHTVSFDEHLLQHILSDLYTREIQSIMVEGGERLLTGFIRAGLWDEARVFTGRLHFHAGVRSPSMDKEPAERIDLPDSVLNIFFNPQASGQ